MQRYRHVQLTAHTQCLLQQPLIPDRDAVVGKARCARGSQSLHIRQLLALHAVRDIGSLQHMYGQLLLPLPQLSQHLRAVHAGRRICHAYDGRISSRCRRCRTGDDILLIGLPRIPEMHMHVHEARRGDPSRSIYDFVIGRSLTICPPLGDARYPAVITYHYVSDRVQPRCRIHHSCPSYQLHGLAPFVRSISYHLTRRTAPVS